MKQKTVRKITTFLIVVYTSVSYLPVVAQDALKITDQKFQELYKQIGLVEGHDKRPVIKKWDDNIKIYAEPGVNADVINALRQAIDTINPSLEKIKLLWVTEKSLGNVVVTIDSFQRSSYKVNWDATNTIYQGVIYINEKEDFNREMVCKKAQSSLLRMLGYFSFKDSDKNTLRGLKSKLLSWRFDVSSFDFAVLKLHYSNEISAGMTEKDLDAYFKKLKK